MYAHLTDPVPSVREFRPTLPAAIDTIIDKAMAKEPDERYAAASELVEELEMVVAAMSDAELSSDAGISMGNTSVKTHVGATDPSHFTPTKDAVAEGVDPTSVTPAESIPPSEAPSPSRSSADETASRVSRVQPIEPRAHEQATELPEPIPGEVVAISVPIDASVDAQGGGTVLSRIADRDEARPPSSAGFQLATPRADSPEAMPRRRQSVAPGFAALALLTLAAGGFFLGHGRSRERPAAPRSTSRVMHSGPMALAVPAAWHTTAAISISGLALTEPIAVSPSSDATSGGMVAGRVPTTWPSFLPAAFRHRIRSGVPPHDIVRLGQLDAFRYARLQLRASSGVFTVYAVPQAKTTSLIVCRAAAGSPLLDRCAGIAASLQLAGASPYPLVPSRSYVRTLNGTMSRLLRARRQGLKSIGTAKTRTAEASAAARIAAAYQKASKRIRSEAPTAFLRPAHQRIAAVLQQVVNAYSALASAAQSGNRSRYDRLRNLVILREAALARELARLKALGFRG
jgi:hypothetical protein